MTGAADPWLAAGVGKDTAPDVAGAVVPVAVGLDAWSAAGVSVDHAPQLASTVVTFTAAADAWSVGGVHGPQFVGIVDAVAAETVPWLAAGGAIDVPVEAVVALALEPGAVAVATLGRAVGAACPKSLSIDPKLSASDPASVAVPSSDVSGEVPKDSGRTRGLVMKGLIVFID